MDKIDLKELEIKIEKNLILQALSSNTLLSRFRMIDENSRKSSSYLDPSYYGFYYHLGKYIEPKSLAEFGFNLGLPSCSFLLSCKSVERFFGYKEKSNEYSSLRLGKSNVKLVFRKEANYYEGKFIDDGFLNIFSPNSSKLWDLIILNNETTYDKHLECLDTIWPQVSENGLVIAEYLGRHVPAKDAFYAFCESKNRKPVMFKTRYGAAILQK